MEVFTFAVFCAANPACEEVGCGDWKPPMIQNPAYKGKWKPDLIDNPNYSVSFGEGLSICSAV